MKSIIIYLAREPIAGMDKPPHHHQSVHTIVNGVYVWLWIRLEVVNGDIQEALDKAKPLNGEIVLNTVPLVV